MKGAVLSPGKHDFTVYFAMLGFLMFFEKFPIFYLSVIVRESVPGAKSCGQMIWLKLGIEVGCDEIFQKVLWLTSIIDNQIAEKASLNFTALELS